MLRVFCLQRFLAINVGISIFRQEFTTDTDLPRVRSKLRPVGQKVEIIVLLMFDSCRRADVTRVMTAHFTYID